MFEIKIKTSGAAFHNEFNPEYDRSCTISEIARILEKICDEMQGGRTEGKAIDYNGNTVGEWKLDA